MAAAEEEAVVVVVVVVVVEQVEEMGEALLEADKMSIPILVQKQKV